MKFSTISSLSGLFAFTSAQVYGETSPLACSNAPVSTVTKTITLHHAESSGSHHHITSAAEKPSITASAGTSTSVAYDSDKSSVWACPTGDGDKRCTVAIYENGKSTPIEVIIVNIQITVDINDITSTVTITKSDTHPTWTPSPPSHPTTSTTSSSNSSATHTVIVGADGALKYSPPYLNAAAGDTIHFDFLAKNHTATQSSLNDPCHKLHGGFDSGFMFNPLNTSETKTADVIVNGTKPMWFYCRQTVPKSHCQAGMVFAVNPGTKFPEFLSKATSGASASGIAAPTGTGISTVTTIKSTGAWSSSKATGESTGYLKVRTVKGRKAAWNA